MNLVRASFSHRKFAGWQTTSLSLHFCILKRCWHFYKKKINSQGHWTRRWLERHLIETPSCKDTIHTLGYSNRFSLYRMCSVRLRIMNYFNKAAFKFNRRWEPRSERSIPALFFPNFGDCFTTMEKKTLETWT